LYHSSFRFFDGGFQGFGGNRKLNSGLLLIFERYLQQRFRKMGGFNFKQFDQLATEITIKQNRAYDLDVLRQTLSLSFLHRQIPQLMSPSSVACVIGDGFGSMTSLLLASKSVGKVILINLTKTLLVDLWYLKQWMGEKVFDTSVNLVANKDELLNVLEKPSTNFSGTVIAIRAVDHELLRYCVVNFGINIASMQEMDPPIISEYFNDLRSISPKGPLYFYCCNREEKQLPDGTITRFSEYPWSAFDQIMVDELCPWHQQYYTFTLPFFRPYDGPSRHRLTVLSYK
jgi:hypothetical protein